MSGIDALAKPTSVVEAMSSNSGAAVRRLQKEITEIKTLKIAGIHDFKVDDSNLLVWECLVVPTEVPYSTGAFRIQMTFPEQYPFKPPTVLFKTKIYHPNIDEKGNVCLNVILPDNWKPATKASNVLTDLVKLINNPEVGHPLRMELAEEFTKSRTKFNRTAEAFTKKHAEKRP